MQTTARSFNRICLPNASNIQVLENKDVHNDPKALLEQIIQRSVSAFQQLFLDMYPALHRFASKLTDDAIASDLVSDVFLKIWEHPHSLTHVKDLRSYLYIMVRNHALNHIKKQQRLSQHALNVASTAPEPIQDDVAKALLDAEAVRLLLKTIDSLPKECAKVVLLGLEGYSTREIAEKLNISASAVSQQKARAIRLLRDKLNTSLFLSLLFLLD